jgi:hypothetical protein
MERLAEEVASWGQAVLFASTCWPSDRLDRWVWSRQGGNPTRNRAIDNALRKAVEQKKIPGVVAMVATADGVVYEGVFSQRDVGANVGMTLDKYSASL